MNEAVNQGGVNVVVDDRGLATVEFFHPLSNSLPGKVLAKLANTITELGENDAVKLILVKSAGERAFCAGASFDELISIEDLDTGKVFFSGFANVINAMRKCPKLIIGRVQGKAVGGGVGLASSVDYCYATKHAGGETQRAGGRHRTIRGGPRSGAQARVSRDVRFSDQRHGMALCRVGFPAWFVQ